MSAVAERIDTSQIRLPGGMGAPTVAGAPDEILREEVPKCLQHIRKCLADYRIEPDKDGMPPVDFEETMPRAAGANIKAIRRSVREIRAIRQELDDRKAERLRKQKADLEEARASLEKVLDQAPAKMQELSDIASKIEPSLDRVRQLVADVNAVTGSYHLAEEIEKLRRHTQTAADALGRPGPDMPTGEADLPNQDDIDALLRVLRGLPKGFDSTLPNFGRELGYSKLDDRARLVKRA